MSETPRVWIGCLGCYNAGHLIGQWWDADEAPEDMETFNEELDGIRDEKGTPADVYVGHYSEQHEELWVFDHEGFQGLLDGECSPFGAREKAELLLSIPEFQRKAFALYVAAGYEPSDFEESFMGEWDSEADYAQDFAESCEYIPKEPTWPLTCIDWDEAADELFNGDLFSIEIPYAYGKVYVYRSV